MESGEVEGQCEVEEATEDYPAVIVEEVPGANLVQEQNYAAQVLVLDDETYLMQEVGEVQEVVTEGETGEVHQSLVFKTEFGLMLKCKKTPKQTNIKRHHFETNEIRLLIYIT